MWKIEFGDGLEIHSEIDEEPFLLLKMQTQPMPRVISLALSKSLQIGYLILGVDSLVVC